MRELIKTTKRRQRGFTLIEVIIVIAIIGIMAAIAVPNFLSWLPNMHLKAASRDLYSNMQKAKMEAIKRNVNVVVVFNSLACPNLPDAVPFPGGGYTIFIDNGAGAFEKNNVQDAGELTLTQSTMPKDVALCLQTFGAGGDTGFNPTGLPIASNFGHVELENNKGRSSKIYLTIAGGIRIE